MATRQASVAGTFYPRQREKLLQQIEGLFKGLVKEEKSRCVVAPHAGYVYSGQTAAYTFNALQKSDCFVILSPNHSGLGEPISVSDADSWETPLGSLPIDKALRSKLLKKLGLQADDLAHIQEHSIEVQLPFLQFLFKKASILPITLMQHNLPKLLQLGKALASLKGSFSVIASSDFTHFEPLQTAKEKDTAAIEKILALDAQKFHEIVQQQRMSICGFAAITAAISYCKSTGLKKGKLLHYDTSATASGDNSNVVGYAAIGFY